MPPSLHPFALTRALRSVAWRLDRVAGATHAHGVDRYGRSYARIAAGRRRRKSEMRPRGEHATRLMQAHGVGFTCRNCRAVARANPWCPLAKCGPAPGRFQVAHTCAAKSLTVHPETCTFTAVYLTHTERPVRTLPPSAMPVHPNPENIRFLGSPSPSPGSWGSLHLMPGNRDTKELKRRSGA